MWRLLLGTMGVKSLVQGLNAAATAGFEPRTVWSEVRRRNRLATAPPFTVGYVQYNKKNHHLAYFVIRKPAPSQVYVWKSCAVAWLHRRQTSFLIKFDSEELKRKSLFFFFLLISRRLGWHTLHSIAACICRILTLPSHVKQNRRLTHSSPTLHRHKWISVVWF